MDVANARSKAVASIDLAHVGGAFAVCDREGRVVGGSPNGMELLTRMGVNLATLPAPIAPELWSRLGSYGVGEAIQWRATASANASSDGDADLLLGCTRYRSGNDAWLLVMREISEKQNTLAQRFHKERLESLGRLVATTVHDLRAPLSSVIFGIDVLATRANDLPAERMTEIVSDVRTAAFHLRSTIDCLMDFVRLGPPQPGEVSIKQVCARLQSLARPQLRTGPHELVVNLPEDHLVRGNPLAMEQILINLIVNSIEAATQPITISISASVEDFWLRVLVEDNGPGIRPEDRLHVFSPMFTTKTEGVGLGLTSARELARSLRGDVLLTRWTDGAAFAVLLPLSTAVSA